MLFMYLYIYLLLQIYVLRLRLLFAKGFSVKSLKVFRKTFMVLRLKMEKPWPSWHLSSIWSGTRRRLHKLKSQWKFKARCKISCLCKRYTGSEILLWSETRSRIADDIGWHIGEHLIKNMIEIIDSIYNTDIFFQK